MQKYNILLNWNFLCLKLNYFGTWYENGLSLQKFEKMKDMIIKNISIGDELLIGQVINTNAAWLGEHLSDAGSQLDSVLTIGDSEKAILGAFNACMDADLVLVTGGLGPTADDITKPTVCKFFNTELEFCQAAYDNLVSLFKRRHYIRKQSEQDQFESECRERRD